MTDNSPAIHCRTKKEALPSMLHIVFQGIIQSPRLVWQALFQPSKAYDFADKSEENAYIFLAAFIFAGLVCGSLLAVPHYYLYQDLLQSFISAFAFEGAFVFVIAFAFAFEVAVTFSSAAAAAVAVAVTFSGAVAGAVTFSGAVAGAVAGNISKQDIIYISIFILVFILSDWIFSFLPLYILQISFILSGLCWLLFGLDKCNIIKLPLNNYLVLNGGWFFMVFSGGGGIPYVLDFEIIIALFAFGISFLLVFTFVFIVEKKNLKNKFTKNKSDKKNIVNKKFGEIAISSLIWCPLIAILFYLLIEFDIKPEMHPKFFILSAGFLIMPVFFLRIPDYLLCLPVWFSQVYRVLKNSQSSTELMQRYQNAILFKHEMLFHELPKLHEFIALIARNEQLGIKEAVKQINYLYLFTFQQTQAEKAIIELGKDREIAHEYIHYLLEEGNRPLLTVLANENPLAELYLTLFEKREGQPKGKNEYSLPLPEAKQNLFAFLRRGSETIKDEPETLEDKIAYAQQEMEKQEGHNLNTEMTATLKVAHDLITAKKIEDFNSALKNLNRIEKIETQISYFNELQSLPKPFNKIKEAFDTSRDVNSFETSRNLLSEQKRKFEILSTISKNHFYEPFSTIWHQAFNHFAQIIQQEIDIQQGTATLNIKLKNQKIPASPGECQLYFRIENTGQEYASDILIDLTTENPEAIFFCGDPKQKFSIIEASRGRELSFSIIANKPAETVIRGTVTFSDRTRENKSLPFSFPITIYEEKQEFQPIPNPYVAGNPLEKQSAVYIPREDAYNFIDQNILTGEEHHTIVCHGLRRTGKSSLLNHISQNGFSSKRLIPVHFDMQGIDDEKDFYLTLTDNITEKLFPGDSNDIDSFGGFKRFIKKSIPAHSDKILVILMDEFEELQMRVEDGRISRTVFSNIRHLMQHENRLIFLFCGTHKLEEMSADYWSIFFNTAIYLKITYLNEQDTEKLIRNPVKEHMKWDDYAVEQIIKMTHGQPYLTQLICRTIVNDLNNTQKRNYATINDVDRAIDKIITDGDDHFSAHIWKESTTLERLILSAAAEEMTQKQLNQIGLTALYAKIEIITDQYSSKECSETLNRLASKDILEQTNGRFCFPVNLLRKWIAARHPLRQVREEI